MADIPDRGNLESMSRIDIQKLCKDNNIKANMRTDEMINALCDLVNGKEVPRPHRSTSERIVSQSLPKSRVSSVQPPTSKTIEVGTKKAALQLSESNTDAESVASVAASVPNTRRKAKEMQLHLGKGRPVLAGGSGARNVTKVVSRGAGRKARASAMLHEDPIPEEEEDNRNTEVPTDKDTGILNKNKVTRPSSVRPLSPIQGVPVESHVDQPSQLPTPAPSHPSYSLPSAQLSALESRVLQLEIPNFDARISQIEATLTEFSILKASVAQIPVLQDEVKHLEAAHQKLEAEVTQWTNAHGELKVQTGNLEAQIKGLVIENGSLKGQITELETKLRDREDPSMTSVIIHSPSRPSEGEGEQDVQVEATVGTGVPATVKHTVFSQDPDLPAPSPSQPTLGKRARSDCDTPDVSFSDIDAGATSKQREDAELAAIHRVIRPQRKRPRLDLDQEEGAPPFAFLKYGHGGPSSTSTPQHKRSNSPPGFFTAGCRAPTPLARTEDANDYTSLDKDASIVDGDNPLPSTAVAGPSHYRAASSLPRTPSKTTGDMTGPESARTGVAPRNDPNFFGGPLPVYFTPSSTLPYPLNPTTPLNMQDILERSTQFTTPVLGEPWKFDATVNPASVSQPGDSVGGPTTPGDAEAQPSSSTAAPPESPGSYTFRAGGRRERDDKYNPYFTPPRGPGAKHRTGITPTRGFSFGLKSPAKMATVPEEGEAEGAELDEDGVVRSPPQFRTLYGTELEGDTRFGDYGRDLARNDWSKVHPR